MQADSAGGLRERERAAREQGRQPELDQCEERLGALERASDELQPLVRGAFDAAGTAGREAKNFLHGTWLGHPLHPVLTDVPIGAWATALVLDGLEVATGRPEFGRSAKTAIKVGLIGALGAAITGVTDWQHTEQRA